MEFLEGMGMELLNIGDAFPQMMDGLDLSGLSMSDENPLMSEQADDYVVEEEGQVYEYEEQSLQDPDGYYEQQPEEEEEEEGHVNEYEEQDEQQASVEEEQQGQQNQQGQAPANNQRRPQPANQRQYQQRPQVNPQRQQRPQANPQYQPQQRPPPQYNNNNYYQPHLPQQATSAQRPPPPQYNNYQPPPPPQQPQQNYQPPPPPRRVKKQPQQPQQNPQPPRVKQQPQVQPPQQYYQAHPQQPQQPQQHNYQPPPRQQTHQQPQQNYYQAPAPVKQPNIKPPSQQNSTPMNQSQVQAAGAWSTDLFDCFNDVPLCLLTWWCPCITFGQVAEIVDQGSTLCSTSGSLYALILAFSGCHFLYSGSYRAKIRRQYGIPGDDAEDYCTHFWCEGCALVQEQRELTLRGYDVPLGWYGNMNLARQRQAQGVQMPPVAPNRMTRGGAN